VPGQSIFNSRHECPVNYTTIFNHQVKDPQLSFKQASKVFFTQSLGGHDILCYANQSKPGNWRIYIPPSLIQNVMKWYHLLLGHCGSTRLYQNISKRFYTEALAALCQNYVCPDQCIQYKCKQFQYGKLPAKEASLTPFSEVHVDLIGLYKPNEEPSTSADNRPLELPNASEPSPDHWGTM